MSTNLVSKATDVLGGIRDGVQRAVLGADANATSAPSTATPPAALVKTTPKSDAMAFFEREDVQRGGFGLIGAAAGAYFYKDHRILGGLGGLALGSGIPAIVRGDYGEASRVMVPAALCIGGALVSDKHPFMMGLAGLVVGGLVEPYVRDAIVKYI